MVSLTCTVSACIASTWYRRLVQLNSNLKSCFSHTMIFLCAGNGGMPMVVKR